MNNLIQSFILANISVSIVYLSYMLFLRKDTFWQTKRFFLFFGLLFSFILPFIDLSVWIQSSSKMSNLVVKNEFVLPEIVITAAKTDVSYSQYLYIALLGIYFLFSIVLFAKFAGSIIYLIGLKRANKSSYTNRHIVVVEVKEDIVPFSFWKWIFINPALHKQEDMEQIILHEETHVKQRHSWDIILAEMSLMILWINPFMWLLRKEIKHNLEYIADNSVLKTGINCKNYQYNLLNITSKTEGLSIVSPFNVSPLKKRIIMMNKEKTSKKWLIKYSMIIPIAIALIFANNINAIANNVKLKDDETQKKRVITIKEVSTNLKKDESKKGVEKVTQSVRDENGSVKKSDSNVYDIADEAPEFQGGNDKLFEYLSKEIKYPFEALNKKIQGRVIAQFVINEDGSISDIKLVRGVHEDLDNEAIRVIKAMPNWTPGKVDGKAVKVQYTLPISFKLDDDKSDKSSLEKKENSDYLVVVDGVQKESGFNINQIKPEDIESISVLKDEAATKKYGDKGKKGVIEITTKKN